MTVQSPTPPPPRARRLWERVWQVIGAVPIGIKIMGVVVVPVLIVVVISTLYLRHEVLRLVDLHGTPHLVDLLHPVVTTRLSILLVGASLLALLLAFVLSVLLTRPLHRLLDVIHRVEENNLSARVDVWAGDELGRVQAAFNAMIARLERSHDKLSRRNAELILLNKMAQALAQARDLPGVIEAGLDTALRLTQADRGELFVFQGQRTALKGELYASRTGNANGEAAGRRLTLEDVSPPPPLPTPSNPVCGDPAHTRCIPLAAQGRPVGLINLYWDDPRALEARDLALLETMSSAIGTGISNVQLRADIERQQAELRRALHRAVQVQEDERRRLSRELHDEAGQSLTALLISLRALENVSDLETIQTRLEGMRYLTAETLENLRRLSGDLRPAALDSLGLVPVLKWHARRTAERSGLEIQLDLPDDSLARLPLPVEVALYRIVQEALTNVIRHSQANRANIILRQSADAVWLTVTDDGVGFDPTRQHTGLGLVGIRERVSLLNGHLTLESAPDAGTHLTVEIPLTPVLEQAPPEPPA